MRLLYEREINAADIVVSPRPVWKCSACSEYGLRPTCPPQAPGWREAAEWTRRYSKALLVKFALEDGGFEEEKRQVLHWLLAREKELFRDHLYVFALFPGSCNLCGECACVKSLPCTDRTRVRPSLDAIGIELDRLTRIDFTENVLHAMIFLE